MRSCCDGWLIRRVGLTGFALVLRSGASASAVDWLTGFADRARVGDCCSERSTGQRLVGGAVRIRGIWRAVVAKTALNSGKSTIGGDFRERFEPLATAGGRAASNSFTFSQFTGLYWFSARSGIGWGSVDRELELLPIVDLPEFDPVFPTSRVEIRLSWRFWSGVVSH